MAEPNVGHFCFIILHMLHYSMCYTIARVTLTARVILPGFHPGFSTGVGRGDPASVTSQILYLITTLDHLELGVVDEGLHFLQCRKLLRRVVEHLPNRHQCCKDFLQTWQTSSS